MPKTIALVTIHGMGDTEKSYYTQLVEAIKKSLGKVIWDKVIFESLYYQDIFQASQETIFNRMRDQIDWMKLRKFLLYGFSDAASLDYKQAAVGSPYFLTQQMIMQAMDRIFDQAGQHEVPVILIAQSLGCHVISNYIWDAQQTPASVGIWSVPRNDGVIDNSPKDNFRRMRSLQCLYTTGCNIPFFVAGHKNIEAISPPLPSFKWYNFFDEDDVLGWPLRPLSLSYQKLVEDISINSGGGVIGTIVKSWNPFSHEQYWADGQVIKHLSSTIRQFA